MKVQVVIAGAIVLSVALAGVIKMRTKEVMSEQKRNRFQDIKLRVSDEVLSEYLTEKSEKQDLLQEALKDVKNFGEEVLNLQQKAERTKAELDQCLDGKKADADKLASLQMDLSDAKAESEKEMSVWNTEIAAQKNQLSNPSPVCNFLKLDSSAARNMCGDKGDGKAKEENAPKQEDPKAEAPKQEEPKAEEPKQEEPKAEEPKQEEPKAEEPKQEEPKAEEPKQEEPKAEEPKQEEPKAEAQR
ncbi:uncharacterized protein ACNS7B_018278 [Menidia menidia]